MEKDPSFEQAAERIVCWAAQNPLSAEEAEQRYPHLLAGLARLPARRPEWAIFTLGKLAVRYWKDRVEDFQQTLDDLTLTPALALRGAGAGGAALGAERILKAEGRTADACVKLTENRDHATVALALWLEPKGAGADSPFTVTIAGADPAFVAGPIECGARSVVRFASVAPGAEYSITFKTEAETWQVRWGVAAAPA